MPTCLRLVRGKRAQLRVRIAPSREAGRGALRRDGPDERAAAEAAGPAGERLGGGFVGSDAIELDVHVEQGATLFLSSQASSKVYRAADARFTLRAVVHGTLVYWPDPVACFAGASLAQQLSF